VPSAWGGWRSASKISAETWQDLEKLGYSVGTDMASNFSALVAGLFADKRHRLP
jgi:hypothetical protein